MNRRTLTLMLAALGAIACSDPEKRTEERLRALEEQRLALKKGVDAGSPAAAGPSLDPFWDSRDYIKIAPDGQCPDGFWALFPGEAPGTGEEKKANAARREDLAKRLRESTFLIRLKTPDVMLEPFDAPKGHFPLTVNATIDCTDSFGHVTVALAPAKAINPPPSAAKADSEVTQSIWQAEPFKFTVPAPTVAEAKKMYDTKRLDMVARAVFRLGKTDVHRRTFKTSKVTEGEITIGGGAEDWGAGRMVRADLLGLRVATDHEKTALTEKKL